MKMKERLEVRVSPAAPLESQVDLKAAESEAGHII